MKQIEELLELAWKLGIKINEIEVPSGFYKELERLENPIPKPNTRKVALYESAFMGVRVIEKI